MFLRQDVRRDSLWLFLITILFELIRSLGHGVAVASLREAAEIIENGGAPEPPTAPLFKYHIRSVVDLYETVLREMIQAVMSCGNA